MIFEALKAGQVMKDELVSVSKRASRSGGSRVFLDAGNKYPLKSLLLTMIVYCANDATIALAERISSSEAGLVQAMTNGPKRLACLTASFVT